MCAQEKWLDISGYKGFYQVSNLGKVRSISHYSKNNANGGVRLVHGKELTPFKMKNGYLQVQLSKNGKREKCYVHRLVANAFLENNDSLPEVNHKNGDKTNNRFDNLEWVSHKSNQVHMIKNRMTKKAMPVLHLITKTEYNSLCEAEKCTGIGRKTIKRLCNAKKEWLWIM